MQALSKGKIDQEKVQVKGVFHNKTTRYLHTNLVGPIRMKELKGEQYFMLLVDDYKRMTVVLFLNKKSEAFKSFKTYKEMIETETKFKIKCLRSNNGVYFTSKEFIEFYNEHAIKRKFLVSRTPQQNVNGFQVDRCFLGTRSAYISSQS
jgi:hypothetical protein